VLILRAEFLGGHADGQPVLHHFMDTLLKQSLQATRAEGYLTQIASAVLPMLSAEPAAFVAAVDRLLQSCSGLSVDMQQQFGAAAHNLSSLAAEGQDTESFAARTETFEKRFFQFAENARKFLYCK
jgi:hypothetical protein